MSMRRAVDRGLPGSLLLTVHSARHGVSNGIRTRDILDHNQVLYQLSYTHQGSPTTGD